MSKHTILVKLEIEAERWEDAIDAVERVLDDSTFQDEINERLREPFDDPPVLSATCDAESAYRNAVLEEAAGAKGLSSGHRESILRLKT